VPILPNTTYYLGGHPFSTGTTSIIYFNQDGTTLSRKYVGQGTFTTPADAYYMVLNFGRPYGTTYNNDVFINYPSTDTSYHSGTSNQYKTISIGQTVNKATYNARTGVMEVTQPSVQTIQLPPCPIDTLEGVNNIWADTGDTTLQYPKFG
jgi:hypothetical protein